MTQEMRRGDRIGKLLRLAGPRPSAPQDAEERVRSAVHDAWRESVRGRQRRRFLVRGGFALAAAASIAAMVGILWQPTLAPEPVFDGPVAWVEALTGSVQLLPVDAEPDSLGSELRVGDSVPAGMVVDTGVLGRAALRLASGSSLRLDRQTRLRGITDRVVALDAGALYFDSGAPGSAGDSGDVEVRTALGVVHDIGTQYEVRLGDESVRVRVREGQVNLDRDGVIYDAGVGVELRVDAAGDLTRRNIEIFGPDWEWILAVAPPFELEGSTLDSFLAWVSRETGLMPSFLDEEAQLGSTDVVLHGSIPLGMRPDLALDAVLPTCGLVHRTDRGILVIEAEGP
jgi:hypothetical protein